MFYGFQATAKGANLTTIPISFGQIILDDDQFLSHVTCSHVSNQTLSHINL